jgi:hypothetical protein
MEQLRKKKADVERRKHENQSRQRKEKAERKKRRQEERRRRGPRTRGIKFTLDRNARLVNADARDPSSPAHETLQRMVMPRAASNFNAVHPNTPNTPGPTDPEIELDLSGNGSGRGGGDVRGDSSAHSATPRRPVGLSNLSDLAAAATAGRAGDVLVGGGDPSSMSVWGSSPTSLSREASPGSMSSSQSASSKAAVSKAWADSVPVSLHQSIIGKSSSPTGVSSSPTGAGSTVTAGVVDSSNPYAGAFASSLQQPFARASNGEVEPAAALSRQSSSNWGSSAGEGDNLSDGGSVEASWGQTSVVGINPGATEFVPGGSGDGAGLASLPQAMAHMEEPSPTLSPQFSAMRPASDKAEFNVMAFPGSLMGNTMGGLGGGGSRSLLGMQGGDSLMGSNLQAPYHQWSADGSTAAGFGYAQQHLQQQHQHALRQQGQALGLGGEAQLGGQQVGGQEVGSQQGQAHRQRQRGGQRNKGGKSKTRPKKSNRNRNRNQDGGNSNNRGGRSGGDGGGGDGGGGGRGGRKKNTRKNKGATSAKKN